jgi:hypothetical protein
MWKQPLSKILFIEMVTLTFYLMTPKQIGFFPFHRGIIWPSLWKIQYTELKLSCGNHSVVKNSIYINSNLDLWPNDPQINRVLPLLQGNHVAKFIKDPIYRTKIIVQKPVWTPARSPARHTQSHNTDRLETGVRKGCTRFAATSDKDYQLLAHGRWFSLGTAASSTIKTGRHDIAESGVKHNKSNQILVSSNPLSRKYWKDSHVFWMVFKACGETVFNFMFVTAHIFKVANFFSCF